MMLTNGRILSRLAPVHRAYTDASVNMASQRTGLGIHRPTATLDMAVRLRPRESLCVMDSNYAEMYALMLGIRSFASPLYEGTNLVVATDSLVSLQQLQNHRAPNPKYARLVEAIRSTMSDHRGYLCIRKVKAHAGIAGNEAAHRLARMASRLTEDGDTKINHTRACYTAVIDADY